MAKSIPNGGRVGCGLGSFGKADFRAKLADLISLKKVKVKALNVSETGRVEGRFPLIQVMLAVSGEGNHFKLSADKRRLFIGV